MIRFYENFISAPSKALALQEAQKALIGGEVRLTNGQIVGTKQGIISVGKEGLTVDLRHLFFWAPFILMGNWL